MRLTESTIVETGIGEESRRAISEDLSRLLAGSYTLYLKTHNYHWNVTGSMFQTLHLMFEHQYMELAPAVDLIAERIRALGFPAPGSYKAFARLSNIREEDSMPAAEEMIRNLLRDHETMARDARSMIEAAEGANDQPTLDLLTQRIQLHEKTAWMLRSLLA
ncbi:MAG TPA: Dps family protein [Thermoanaerobaculia bacterium]|nr:Dps family protein [Thermoanaerobaculia bacterium]